MAVVVVEVMVVVLMSMSGLVGMAVVVVVAAEEAVVVVISVVVVVKVVRARGSSGTPAPSSEFSSPCWGPAWQGTLTSLIREVRHDGPEARGATRCRWERKLFFWGCVGRVLVGQRRPKNNL